MPTLEEVRRSKFINQRELAEKSGLSRGTIIGIETGKVRPYTHTIRAIAAALGVEPGQIDWPTEHASKD